MEAYIIVFLYILSPSIFVSWEAQEADPRPTVYKHAVLEALEQCEMERVAPG